MTSPLNGTVMWLTWRQLFARRRLWVAVAFALLPALFTIGFRILADDGGAARASYFNSLSREIVIGTLLPLAALVFGTTAFGGEVDDGTLIYLLVKPIRRWRLFTSKMTVSVLSTLAVVSVAIVLPWSLLSGPDIPNRAVLSYLGGCAVGTLLYTAMFLALGLWNKRALVIGLLYIIAYEAFLSRGMPGLGSFSVRSIALGFTNMISAGSVVIDGAVPKNTVLIAGAIILAVATFLTAYRLSRYEVAERL